MGGDRDSAPGAIDRSRGELRLAQGMAASGRSGGTPGGNIGLSVDGIAQPAQALSGGSTTFTIPGPGSVSLIVDGLATADSPKTLTAGAVSFSVGQIQVRPTPGLRLRRRGGSPSRFSRMHAHLKWAFSSKTYSSFSISFVFFLPE